MDQFVPGRLVPSCQLHVKWNGQQEQSVELAYRVELLGAKEPFNYFLIHPPSVVSPIPPPSMYTSQSNHGVSMVVYVNSRMNTVI